ncbi:MAG: hypothetical protein ACRDSR_25655 [Pseudonocardiaceae bacterium]
MAWIVDQARADELFRRDLLRHNAPTDRAAQERELTDAAAQLLRSHPPSGYLTTRGHERTSSRCVTTLGVFGPPGYVLCVTDFPPHLETQDGTAIVLAAGKKITVPADALPALRPLLSGHPVGVEDVTAATGIDTAALADVLIREGVCAELTPDLAEGYAYVVTAAHWLGCRSTGDRS